MQAYARVLRLQPAHRSPPGVVSGRSARAVAHEGEHPADSARSTNRPVAPGGLLEHPHSVAELAEPHAVVADQGGENASVVDRGCDSRRSCSAAAVAHDPSQLLSSAAVAAGRAAATRSTARKRKSTTSKSSFERAQPATDCSASYRDALGVGVHVTHGSKHSGSEHGVTALVTEGSMRTRIRMCLRRASAALNHAPVQIRKTSPSSLAHGLQVALADEPQGGIRREVGEGVEMLRVVDRGIPDAADTGDVVVRHGVQVLDEAVEVRGDHHPLHAIDTAAEQTLVPCRTARDVVVDEHPIARLHKLAERGVRRREDPRTRRSPAGRCAGQAAERQPMAWQSTE